MIRFTDEMRERLKSAFYDKKTCLLGTASKEGVPSISFRGSLMVYDDDHLATWERSLQSSVDNLEENPHVVVLYVDIGARIGWRFYGEATMYKSGEIRQRIMERTIKEELDKDPERKGYGVLIRVDKIRRFAGDEVLQER